ncbi:rhodanese [Rhodobacterales bacterium 56_14_T64]|nr:rhodanese [Rhodobacterales bacterium 56_14_T64]
MPQTTLSRRHILLGGAAVVAVTAVGFWWRSQAPDHDHPRLAVAEAYQQAQSGDITLIDIRTPIEWKAIGVPVGGHQIDMRRKDFVEAVALAVGGNRSAPIALICARGVRSARMTLALSEAGFSNIIDVPEGMLGSRDGPGWVTGNLPVARWQE